MKSHIFCQLSEPEAAQVSAPPLIPPKLPSPLLRCLFPHIPPTEQGGTTPPSAEDPLPPGYQQPERSRGTVSSKGQLTVSHPQKSAGGRPHQAAGWQGQGPGGHPQHHHHGPGFHRLATGGDLVGWKWFKINGQSSGRDCRGEALKLFN